MSSAKDISVGDRFGRYAVIGEAPPKIWKRPGQKERRDRRWKVRCDCGAENLVPAHQLKAGQSRSCGCLRSIVASARVGRKNPNFVHGEAGKTPTHSSWCSMIQRCTNPNATAFSVYGGRGIGICEEWRSFERFLADMGERPSGTTLDRIDPDGDYEPGNCRWAGAKTQRRNQREEFKPKLSPQKVREIRARAEAGATQQSLADEFGVSRATVGDALSRRTWADVC